MVNSRDKTSKMCNLNVTALSNHCRRFKSDFQNETSVLWEFLNIMLGGLINDFLLCVAEQKQPEA